MVEQLTRQCPRPGVRAHRGRVAVPGLPRRDADRRLHDAVETAPVAPRSLAAPGRHRHHDQPRVPLGERGAGQPEPGKRTGPVAVDQHIGAGQQLVQPRGAVRGGRVQQCAALADQPVVAVDRQLGAVRVVQPQDVGAECGEVAGGHRAGNHPGQVQHPDAGRGQRPWPWLWLWLPAARAPCRAAGVGLEVGVGDQRLTGDHPAVRVRQPLLGAAQCRGHPTGVHHSLFGFGGREFGERGGHPVLVGVERGEQRRPVPRIVRVRADPAVRGAPEPGQRREPRAQRCAVDQQVRLAPDGGRHLLGAQRDLLPGTWRNRLPSTWRGRLPGTSRAGRAGPAPAQGHRREQRRSGAGQRGVRHRQRGRQLADGWPVNP
ncbi:MAG: hypothetical protein QOC67_1250 [Pseudonocardiales bacterium]|nr:hypothetical protein [Pseudonocardiales bacterium]